MKTDQSQPPTHRNSSTNALTTIDSPEKDDYSKSELLAKLNDMKSAIDSYKDYKAK